MALRNGWKVDKSNPDTERFHLNKVLSAIRAYIDALVLGGQVDSVVAGTGIDVDATDPENPEVALDAGTQASLALADTALQPGEAEPPITAGTTAQFWRGDKTWSDTLTGDLFVSNNVRVGYGAAGAITSTVVGRLAQENASSIATEGVFIGYQAGRNVANGQQNTAVGSQAMGLGITTGQRNSAFGALALRSITSGANNVAVGYTALGSNLTGNSNMALGSSALRDSTSGANNVAVGTSALQGCTTASNNIGIGTTALLYVTTGQRNIGIGVNAGVTGTAANANVSGSDNTYIGHSSGPGSATQRSFATAIGSGALVDSNNTIVFGRAASDFAVFGATANSGGGCKVQVTGHLGVLGAGNGLRVAEGSNAKMGTATLVAGTVTVANTAVTANSRIFLTSQVDGGTPGFLRVSARTAGTNFTITSSSATDTSTVAYLIMEPAT